MKRLFLLFAFICLGAASFAQNTENRWAVGLFGGKTEYNGDLGNGFFNFNKAFYPIGAISLNRYINSSFNLGIFASYGDYGYKKDNTLNFFGTKTDASMLLTYKFANGYILNESIKLEPYITAGFGVAHLTGNRIWNGRDFLIPIGGGIKYNLCKTLAIQYQLLFNYTNNDKRDGFVNGAKDMFASHTLGFVISIGGKRYKDDDKDGVVNKDDLCPDIPGLVSFNGCPDSDGDGVPDYKDKCPNVKGLPQFDGCPDTDGDGIPDYLDRCPNVKGLPQFDGCPDTDGDGIPDYLDKCPNVKGLPQFDGCPDSDGDGIPDNLDRCPNEKGPAALQGCPDRDGDGIPDIDDKCPDKAGPASNNGCPDITPEEKLVFEKALRGIQFETGKSTILTVSYPIINEVVGVMYRNPGYNLEISGHTDNTGTTEFNLKLSKERAEAVKTYVTEKGIDSNRIKTNGYGDTRPVSDNYSDKGRALNRRVEFKVTF
jgi:Outer membrane protein and related peptidoglycan-associated (lipo)proteins